MKLPTSSKTADDVLATMRDAAKSDADWRGGKTWSLVYNAGEDVESLIQRAYVEFFMTNGLSPMAFPSLKRFENEVLAMTADLLGAPDAAGSITTGGTESILMAMKTARDLAGKPDPEALVPITAHPAFQKAAHYLGIKIVPVPVDASFRADVDAAARLITKNTIVVVGSAPSYPQGVIDPIPELAALAAAHGTLCHVDACVGGFFLPFLERLGEPVAPWDFRVPGVTSISADLHKYGYAARGASTVLYRDRALRRHQYFTYADWPGGLYASPSMTGSRAGGPIAAAWAVLNYLGVDGYLRLTKQTIDTARALMAAVRSAGLRVLGSPAMSVFSFVQGGGDVYQLCDAMEQRGWRLDRQQLPPSAHMMVTPGHAKIVDAFARDLAECAGVSAGAGAPAAGTAAMYGMLGAMPDRAAVSGFLLEIMDSLG
jgi:glutamate/tyrosine decarboxylase-like PLP-dependent enzyme